LGFFGWILFIWHPSPFGPSTLAGTPTRVAMLGAGSLLVARGGSARGTGPNHHDIVNIVQYSVDVKPFLHPGSSVASGSEKPQHSAAYSRSQSTYFNTKTPSHQGEARPKELGRGPTESSGPLLQLVALWFISRAPGLLVSWCLGVESCLEEPSRRT